MRRKEREKKRKREEKGLEAESEDDPVEETPETAVQSKMQEAVAAAQERGQKANVRLNLAWTGPMDNTELQGQVSFAKVASVALDLFCDPDAAVKAASAEKTGPTEEGAEGAGAPLPKQSPVEILLGGEKLPWKIPPCVERGFEIPICVTRSFAMPEKGRFPRLGMDAVVNAVWLAYYWAKQEGDADVVSALRSLILDWPMDFVLVEGSAPEELAENKFLWGVTCPLRLSAFANMSAWRAPISCASWRRRPNS